MRSFERAVDDIVFFNEGMGLIDPAYSPSSEQFYLRLKQMAGLLKEELDETVKAVEDKNNVEILDGACDIFVVLIGFMKVLENAGFRVNPAVDAVCDNNATKILVSREDAAKSVAYHAVKGVDAYVDTVTIYGETYYSVRRSADGKGLKPHNFKPVNLQEYVPTQH